MKTTIKALLAAVVMLAGCGNTEEKQIQLAPPENLHSLAELATSESLTFGWDAVQGADSYTYKCTDTKGSVLHQASTSATEVTISRLAAAIEYRFAVMANGSGTRLDSQYSSTITAKTSQIGTVRTPLSIPTDVICSEVSVASATIRWTAVPNAVSYRYELTLNGTTIDSGQSTSTSVTIVSLSEATPYSFRVKALPQDGSQSYDESEYCAAIEFRTLVKPTQTYDFALPANEQDGLVRAFPGAEGGGMFTTGGRGGKVYHVTTLNDDASDKGSLRYALSQSGARTIVFDVDGIIALQSSLRITKGDVTIAGQTAPGDGICLKNYAMIIDADNVIVRFIRCRMGDEKQNEDDAFWGRYHKNIIIDHCSMSWSADECSSFYGNRNFTMQWCILAESMRNSTHIKGTHGYGAIWGGVAASYHHNLLAHHDSRNPRFDAGNVYVGYTGVGGDSGLNNADRAVDYRNCVVYNFCNFPAYGGEGIKLNFVANTYKWGPASVGGTGVSYKLSGETLVETASKVTKRRYFYYVSDTYQNVQMDCPHIYTGGNTNALDTSVDDASIGAAYSADNRSAFVYDGNSHGATDIVWRDNQLPIMFGSTACRVTTHSAADAFDAVLNYAGASLRRDAVDERVTLETRNGTSTYNGSRGSLNGLIDSQTDVGGWPTYAHNTPAADTDGDGIPDNWEKQYGLDPANSADGAARSLDVDERYTNLELYLHSLVKQIVAGQVQGGSYTTLD